MYNIPYFKENDRAVLLAFMKSNSFALVTACSPEGPVATQVPLLVEERAGKLVLRGHLMRATDHHKAMSAQPAVLCVFTGPHAYVSARHYNDAHTASTWNYMSVHARGNLRFLEEHALVDILRDTTNQYEADPSSPANFENLPPDYVARLAKAIVGFEIEVLALENVFKLSQNKKKEEYLRIVDHLRAGEGEKDGIGSEMQQRIGRFS